MRRKKIAGDGQRMSMLATLVRRVAVDRRNGRPPLFARFEGVLAEEAERFKSVVSALDKIKVDRDLALARRKALAEQLEMVVRDFWTVMRLRTRRLGHNDATLALYYPLGRIAKPPRYGDVIYWLGMGRAIVDGDKTALRKGLPAMQNPSANDVAMLVTQTAKAHQEALDARGNFAEHQGELEARRVAVDSLLRDIAGSMERALKSYEPAKRRRIMRSYGFCFSQDKRK